MRTIRVLHPGVFLSLVGAIAGCELIADLGDPTLRKPDGGTGGHGGATTSSSTSSSSTSTSSGTGGAEPTCTDEFKNGAETGKDCGGGTCPACPLGEGCIVGTDCESLACSPNHICVPSLCDDQIKNDTESDIDCGGLTCPGCVNGKACLGNGDCLSGNCVANICQPPSCAGGGAGLSDCGPTLDESCCMSLPVVGGTFKRSYDGVSFTDASYPATVSGFRLDKYEVTVGRFRQFVNAWVNGWRPQAGAGKHSHLNGGKGLANGASPGTSETGWNTAWDMYLAETVGEWDTSLQAGADATWTSSVAGNEKRPINYIAWYEAYAFCVWDGGFLPSDAEWNFAAAGGSEQRVYPWSIPSTSTVIDCSHVNYYHNGGYCSATHANDVGSESPTGNGKWGQAGLSGNVAEWTVDRSAALITPCDDCADLTNDTTHVTRGGSFAHSAVTQLASSRSGSNGPSAWIGIRCARNP